MNSMTERREFHGITLRAVCFFICLAPVIVLVIAAVVTTFKVGFYALTPTRYWFEYNRVQTLEELYPPGVGVIELQSFVAYKHDNLHMHWVDELRCQNQYGEFYLVQSVSTHGTRSRRPQIPPTYWRMHAQHPDYETICYIESTIAVDLEGGVRKQTVIRSNEYALSN